LISFPVSRPLAVIKASCSPFPPDYLTWSHLLKCIVKAIKVIGESVETFLFKALQIDEKSVHAQFKEEELGVI